MNGVQIIRLEVPEVTVSTSRGPTLTLPRYGVEEHMDIASQMADPDQIRQIVTEKMLKSCPNYDIALAFGEWTTHEGPEPFGAP